MENHDLRYGCDRRRSRARILAIHRNETRGDASIRARFQGPVAYEMGGLVESAVPLVVLRIVPV